MKNDQIRKVVGQRVKHYRKIHSLTQKQLAAEIGAVSSYITNIEVGQKGISLEKIIELCEYFDISVSDLLPLEIKSENDEKEYIIKNITNSLRTWGTEQVKLLETMVIASDQVVTK